jgi:hypothetical protein
MSLIIGCCCEKKKRITHGANKVIRSDAEGGEMYSARGMQARIPMIKKTMINSVNICTSTSLFS